MKTELKIKPITKELVKEAEDLAQKAGRLEGDITDRIHYIMTSIFKLFGEKNAYWYFYGAGEGEVGDFWSHYYPDTISVVIESCPDNMIIILKDNSEWLLNDSIPTRWLFEDFEKELTEGKAKYERLEQERLAKKKQYNAAQKLQNKKLIEQAKKKLSKEELAALKSTL